MRPGNGILTYTANYSTHVLTVMNLLILVTWDFYGLQRKNCGNQIGTNYCPVCILVQVSDLSAEFSGSRRLVEAAAAQVVGDDDVGDGVEHELDVVSVCGARHVAVDLLGGGFVLSFELCLDVRRRLAVFLRA